MIVDLIMSSLKIAWADGGYTALMPAGKIYFDRAQVPDELAGFPYAECFVSREDEEVTQNMAVKLCTYRLRIKTWTCQAMTGGTTTGDQLTDQGNLHRALESILNAIPPNTTWYNVSGFLHCIPSPGMLETGKDEELYRMDVITVQNEWTILASE